MSRACAMMWYEEINLKGSVIITHGLFILGWQCGATSIFADKWVKLTQSMKLSQSLFTKQTKNQNKNKNKPHLNIILDWSWNAAGKEIHLKLLHFICKTPESLCLTPCWSLLGKNSALSLSYLPSQELLFWKRRNQWVNTEKPSTWLLSCLDHSFICNSITLYFTIGLGFKSG